MGENAPAKPDRLDAVDMLRGLVMVIMALDHVRDFWSNRIHLDPTDLKTTTAAIFLTRWITHYCAPTFIFLAGTGAFLSLARGKTKRELSLFLFTRGLWLAFFEVVINRFMWMFNFDFIHHGAGVFWAIGLSMIALSILVYLPTPVVTIIGVAMIGFHNMLDGMTAAQVHLPNWWWVILHSPGDAVIARVSLPPGDLMLWKGLAPWTNAGPWTPRDVTFGTGYCLIPWMGVMAAGYGLGALLQVDRRWRRGLLFVLGAALTLAFIRLRLENFAGDPRPWSKQPTDLFTVLSFLNCTKYPPSLLYLLMTLGPAIMLLSLFDRPLGPAARPIITFGRVPLFFYLLHIPLIHGGVVLYDLLRFHFSPQLTDGPWAVSSEAIAKGVVPPEHGVSLPVVYLLWIAVVFILYWPCRWWAGVKQRHRHWLLSYL
jgi:uncharacterized membrane protein